MAHRLALTFGFVVLFVAVGASMYAAPYESVDGCTTDHVATNGSVETSVQICNDMELNQRDVLGLSWVHNDTIQVEQGKHMARTYVHELGHQSGYGHEYGTIMDQYVNREKPACGLGETEKSLANEWDTLSIGSVGGCQYIDTPYGKVF